MVKRHKSRTLCRNYANGTCAYGEKCSFVHEQEHSLPSVAVAVHTKQLRKGLALHARTQGPVPRAPPLPRRRSRPQAPGHSGALSTRTPSTGASSIGISHSAATDGHTLSAPRLRARQRSCWALSRKRKADDVFRSGSMGASSAEDAELQHLTKQFVELVEKARHGSLIAEVERLKQAQAALAAEKAELASELASTSAKYAELKEELRAQVARSEGLQRELAHASKDRAALGERLGEFVGRTAELASTCAKNVELEKELRTQAAKSEGLERELADASREKAEFRDRLEIELSRTAELAQKLARASSEQGHASPKSGAEWQFSTGPNEWSSFPADRSEELQARFEEYSKKVGPTLVRMKSGVEEYEIDLNKLQQTNVKTRKVRSIRCALNTPAHWTRSTSLAAVYHLEASESVELSGFFHQPWLNDVYTRDVGTEVNRHPVWWNTVGDVMMYYYPDETSLIICPVEEDYQKIRAGELRGSARRRGAGSDPLKKAEWEEFFKSVDGEDWLQADVVPRSPTPSGSASLMSIAAEVSDARMIADLAALLKETVGHQSAHYGASACDSFKNGVEVIRVVRVENWHLWMKYRSHAEQMRRDLLKYGVQVQAIEPRLPNALEKFSNEYGQGLDAALNEHLVFHGTSYKTAVQIALEGFDFRLSKPGYYGQGTYFACQACKSHQYTKAEDEMHTVLLSRVTMGDVHYAEKVDKACRRPPLHMGTARCCDSVVAKPGPMPGHKHNVQTHQEFVIFDQFQAYPELIVQYVLKA